MDNFVFPGALWAGTDHSLMLANAYYKKLGSGVLSADMFAADEEGAPYTFKRDNNIGIISIQGPLINSDSWLNRFFGATSYAEIRRSALHALTDPEVKAILLDIKSGGGAVNGVDDTANLLKAVGKVKPVYAFTDETMASAAYWLGSTAKKVYTGKTAIMGSIGVIVTHMEMSKQLEKEGIGVTVMRSGKYKALVNQIEPLSDIAKKQTMDQLMAADEIFIEHVSQARKVSVEEARERMGQGREFFGSAAVDAGLADGVRTFDGVIAEIRRKELDKDDASGSNVSNLFQGTPMTRKALTQQQQLAMLNGSGLFAEGELALLQANLQATETATAATGLPAAPAPAAPSPAAPSPSPAPVPPVVPVPALAADVGVVSMLQSQLKDATDSSVNLRVELAQAQAKVTSLQALSSPLLKIAAESVKNMRCALNLASINLEAMTPEALLTEHTATAATYAEKFKVGGVAAVAVPNNEPVVVPQNNSLREARIASTRLSASH